MAHRVSLLATLLLSCLSLFAQFKFTVENYPANFPNSIAVADFDRDGYPDIALSTFQDGKQAVDVYFNNGDGSFRPFVSYPVPSAGAIVAADFNGDGWPDIIVAGLTANQNSLLLNDRTGVFHLGPAPHTQQQTVRFVAGDFNGDGRVDVAAVEGSSGQPHQIEILKNNGNNTFSTTQTLKLSSTFTLSAVAYDFDGDGKLDIAETTPNRIQIWWGLGNATFGPPLSIPSPSADPLISLVNADFDHDAKEDIAANTFHPCSDPTNFCGFNTVWIYRNLGKRTFKIVSSFRLGTGVDGFLHSTDLNGDLKPDIAMLNDSVWVGSINYRFGNGNGTFGPEQNLTGTTAPEIAFRDLNRDTRKDVAIASNFPGGELDVLLSTSGNVGCASPGTKTLASHICAPAAGSTVSNPVVFRATGDSPVGVKRLELWIDGVKRYQKLGDQMATSLTLSPGSHQVTVVAVDQYTGYRKSSRTITVR